MKTVTRIAITLATALSALLPVSCTRFEKNEKSDAEEKVFQAAFESPETESETKTFLASGHKLRWTFDDRLSIFEGNTYNQQYRYAGATGLSFAIFEKVPSAYHSSTAISSNFAVYPYQSSTEISRSELITLDLPAVQKYESGSFGPGANTMVAVTKGKNDNFLSFKNLCGYLVIRLYGEGTVRNITLTANNGEKISGKAMVKAGYGQAPSITMSSSAGSEIKLDCGKGVALESRSDKATEFWFCVPPTTFSKGFTVKVENMEGATMVRSVSSSRTIVRNLFYFMSVIKAEFESADEPEAVDLGLSVKWANCNLGAGNPEEYGDYYAWGETSPHYQSGYAQEDPQNHWNKGYSSDGYGWSCYKLSTTTFAPSVLPLKYDAAQAKLGAKWRMPTSEEMTELKNNCTWEWTSLNGISGYKVSGTKNGYTDKWIFLPASGTRVNTTLSELDKAGYYWSSSINPDRSRVARALGFSSASVNTGSDDRCYGLPVRPVSE